MRTLTVDGPARLDQYLLHALPDFSRDGLMRLLANGRVSVDGHVRVAGFRLRGGEFIQLAGDLTVLRIPATRLPLEILHEDDDLIAIHKPAGMLSHPTAQERDGTAINALRAHTGLRVSLLHRLDRATSGVLLAAKHRAAAAHFGRLFESREVEKTYLAVACGRPSWQEFTVSLPIERVSGRTPPWNIGGSREAVTLLRNVKQSQADSLLIVKLLTGRTNQIRIHCAAIGHPLAGDTQYGGRPASRLYLHAYRLSVDRLAVTALPPVDFLGGFAGLTDPLPY